MSRRSLPACRSRRHFSRDLAGAESRSSAYSIKRMTGVEVASAPTSSPSYLFYCEFAGAYLSAALR
jgi:hypothetical protein